MSTIVKANYERFVQMGPVPGTDFENSVLEEILNWADEIFDDETKLDMADVIDAYWLCILEGVQIEAIVDEEIAV